MNWHQFTRIYALVIGVSFTLAGIGGFVSFVTPQPPPDAPALTVGTSYGLLIGLFPINVIHNLFHLGTGIFGLLAFRGIVSLRGFIRVFGIILAGLTILGLIPSLDTLGGLMPIYGHDIWLHGLEAVIALGLGFVVSPQVGSVIPVADGRSGS